MDGLTANVLIAEGETDLELDLIMGGGGPKGYNSDTGGVVPMDLGGRLVYERERLFGMTPAERAYRAQFLKDQELAPHEPVEVPEMYTELHNPLRRFYRRPGNAIQKWLEPRVGGAASEFIRFGVGKSCLGAALIMWGIYYVKYNGNTWEQHNGVRMYTNKRTVFPGEPGYPQPNVDHPGSFYVDRVRGFTDAVPDL